jgi:hypothetical protein
MTTKVLGANWSIYQALIRVMEHCYCYYSCYIRCEIKDLRKGFYQCEKDVAETRENVTYSAIQWVRLQDRFEEKNTENNRVRDNFSLEATSHLLSLRDRESESPASMTISTGDSWKWPLPWPHRKLWLGT